jgi:hypothetical protein
MNIVQLLLTESEGVIGIENIHAPSVEILACGAVVLIALGVASRRWINFFVAALLAVLGFLVVAQPGEGAPAIAVAAALGSILTTLAGVRARRLERSFRKDLDRLAEEVQRLQAAADRQFLRSLNPATTVVSDGHKNEDAAKRELPSDPKMVNR